ncbi:hypothetical protein [Rhodoferax sp.]|uniref:hypothetical protein n=1 Tax=Rhodoferax sp. TaxID=50421 RepID=UPI00284584FF|nr:hypothetical protein [Rhodoferax sp.]MDR3370141.1 hypothetical protein [Rhodoferax sp.]
MSGTKKLMQWLFLAAAGSASFYGAMRWRSGAEASHRDLVGPHIRTTTRTPTATNSIAPSSDKTASSSGRDGTIVRPERTHVVPQSGGDAFVRLSWLPPPPVVHVTPPKPVAPPVPVAPPIPFTFVGLIERGTSQPQAFLSKGDTLLVVAAGDVIDNNTYRVDSLSAQQIVVTYLPMNTPQTLSILGTSK